MWKGSHGRSSPPSLAHRAGLTRAHLRRKRRHGGRIRPRLCRYVSRRAGSFCRLCPASPSPPSVHAPRFRISPFAPTSLVRLPFACPLSPVPVLAPGLAFHARPRLLASRRARPPACVYLPACSRARCRKRRVVVCDRDGCCGHRPCRGHHNERHHFFSRCRPSGAALRR